MTTSAWTVRETAAYYAGKVQRLREAMGEPGYKRSLTDALTLESATAFLNRVARDDLDIFAPESPDTGCSQCGEPLTALHLVDGCTSPDGGRND